VIVLIVGIAIAAVGLNLARSDAELARDEAERLAAALQGAQDEAILHGRPYVIELAADGYRFLQLGDDGKLAALPAGEPLAPYRLPEPMALSAELEGANADTGSLLLDPGGPLPAFVINLRLRDARWQVHNRDDGRIRPSIPAG
jgi:type II secretion system protein H